MLNLLQVELSKILKKRSIYIIWGLMLIFCLLNNFLYLKDYDEEGNYKYLEQEDLKTEETNLHNELKNYDKDNKNEVTMYITIKTKLEILTLKQKFSQNSWQFKKINNYLYDIIYQSNYYKYIEKDYTKEKEIQEKYQIILNELNNDNYKYFLNKEIEENIELQKTLKEKYLNEKDKKINEETKQQIEEVKFNLKILNYRLKNNIKEDNSYLNNALEEYQENYKNILYYKSIDRKKTYQEELNYQDSLSKMKISQYIIENKQNINKQNNLNYQLRTIVEDYEIFLVILILIVCSIIVCDEFKTGTIKLLLIKPYSRGKILLSKYLTTIIVITLTILLLIFTQILVGGLIFSFESIDIPVVIYDFTKECIVKYSVFEYMLIRIISIIPFYLMLITISFLLSVIFSSTIITITIPMMLYMFTPTITYITKQYQLNFMKYFVNINWNLQKYLFGKIPDISFINLKFSIIILLIYFITLLILTFLIFRKKNIKNI